MWPVLFYLLGKARAWQGHNVVILNREKKDNQVLVGYLSLQEELLEESRVGNL